MCVSDQPHVRREGCLDVDVDIADAVLRIWLKYVQDDARATEACGALIGGYTADLDRVHIVKCTRPGVKDARSRTGFVMKSRHHDRAVQKAFRQSGGVQFYLGNWHTHPCDYPVPSAKDLADWKLCVERNPSIRLFVFVIVGIKETLLRIQPQGEQCV